ncbi:carboxypeptidase-like regulatory domain-containing protein [Pedobacter endophyticus]|uniref:Carboxypeptidase-like regulatory domain-containing protein n=1 Tax=Pedobacter endophyticus TaxID=2789740 RepID=A0A7U3SPL0_9SPHI|nr:carboxypeptidase-like regulatory domain-containing protein [Pedobacter endophyticus]QPH38718.1 carboxypeptidase-like regulatory domain-containing protein [Pedobacter endophyticus]
MRHLVILLLVIFEIVISSDLRAEELYNISGTATDENNKPIQGATVFISGAQKVTVTDAGGISRFVDMQAGNYLVSTKMLGYNSPSVAITLRDKSVNLLVNLEIKSITLDEVSITSNQTRHRYLKIFQEQFLGHTADKQKCLIVNPEVISLTGKQNNTGNLILKGEADDLIIIDNFLLGYRIKYLLRSFVDIPE